MMPGISAQNARSFGNTGAGLTRDREVMEGGAARTNQSLRKQLKLMLVSSRGWYEDVKRLLSHGASVKFSDYDKRTPLHVCAARGHLNVCLLLIEHGVDIAAKDRWGNTALSEARDNGRTAIVQMLVQHGADEQHVEVMKLKCPHCGAVKQRTSGGADPCASRRIYRMRTLRKELLGKLRRLIGGVL